MTMLDAFWRANQSHHNITVHGHQWQQNKKLKLYNKTTQERHMNSAKNTRKFETNTHQS